MFHKLLLPRTLHGHGTCQHSGLDIQRVRWGLLADTGLNLSLHVHFAMASPMLHAHLFSHAR